MSLPGGLTAREEVMWLQWPAGQLPQANFPDVPFNHRQEQYAGTWGPAGLQK